MKIKLTTVYVNDQEKALRFYTEVLGFTKKADFSNGPFRWLTVVSTEEPTGTELQLALNDNPAAKAYQQATFQQNQSALMFYSDDVAADYERLKAKGADFVLPPTDVTASIIARLSDACGNRARWRQPCGRTMERPRCSTDRTPIPRSSWPANSWLTCPASMMPSPGPSAARRVSMDRSRFDRCSTSQGRSTDGNGRGGACCRARRTRELRPYPRLPGRSDA